MRRTITVAATEAEWRDLLAALPKCMSCGGIAEVLLDGRPRCCGCAASVRRGRCVGLDHSEVALRILDAVQPSGGG